MTYYPIYNHFNAKLRTATMTQVNCFSPIESPDARMLILGSMPGKESLRAGQYYAHPRNAFWGIAGSLAGATPDLPYELRTDRLKSAGIALWDVLASCSRPGSLDSDIVAGSIHPNDFASFFMAHPGITRVFFNGAMAEQCYREYVLPSVESLHLTYMRLPSTSPAHAALSFEQKLAAWRTAIEAGR